MFDFCANLMTDDGLAIDDECVVSLASERERAGEDPADLVRDAIEIGARVLDREQAAANTEFVKTDLLEAAKKSLGVK